MFLSEFRVGFITIAACMLALARVLGSSLKEKSMIAEKQAEDALECLICHSSISFEGQTNLMICPGSGTNPHGFHDECIAGWLKVDPKRCPLCRKDWISFCKDALTKMTDDLILFYTEYKKLPEPPKLEKKVPGDASYIEELKEIIAQLGDDFEILKASYDFIRDYDKYPPFCKRLTEAYGLSDKHSSFLLEPKMGEAFGEIVEEVLKKLPWKKACQALLNAPKFAYTGDVFYLINSPVFYAQLSYEQIVDFGKYLLSLASGDDKFKDSIAYYSFIEGYIQYNLNVLDNDAVECLFDLTERLGLEKMQFRMLQAISKCNVELSLNYRGKLAKLGLATKLPNITKFIPIILYLGYFTKFTDKMREEVINRWKEIRDKDEEHEAFFKILSFKTIKPEENSEAEALELLKGLCFGEPTSNKTVLYLKWCHCMLCLQPSSLFLDKIYSLLEIANMHMAACFIDFIPSSNDTLRRNMALFNAKLKKFNSADLSVVMAVYAHSDIYFEDAMEIAFIRTKGIEYLLGLFGLWVSPFIRAEMAGVYLLELFNSCFNPFIRARIGTVLLLNFFRIYFREDLKVRRNAELFFKKLEENKLYSMMLMFHEYLSEIPRYEKCIAEHMGQIIKSKLTDYTDFGFWMNILWALCDTNSERINEALCEHLMGYLGAVLEKKRRLIEFPPLLAHYILEMIFTKNIFVRHLTTDRVREIALVLITNRKTRGNFERYIEILFSRMRIKNKRTEMLLAMERQAEMLLAMEDEAFLRKLDDDAKYRVKELVKKLSEKLI